MRAPAPKDPECFVHGRSEGHAWLEVSSSAGIGKAVESTTSGIDGAWAEDGFRLEAGSSEGIDVLDEVAAAISAGDFAAYVGGGFDARGLVLLIVSRTPASIRQEMEQHDLDEDGLASAAIGTGIAERLKSADAEEYGLLRTHDWFALTPAWRDQIDRMGAPMASGHDVVFFLNPVHQDRFESGWFTVEELDAWISGQGPIVRNVVDPRMAS